MSYLDWLSHTFYRFTTILLDISREERLTTDGLSVIWFTLIVGGYDHLHRYHRRQGYEDQQYEDPSVQLLVVSIPELVGLRAVNQFIDIY